MTPAERILFEQKLEEDPVLREELEEDLEFFGDFKDFLQHVSVEEVLAPISDLEELKEVSPHKVNPSSLGIVRGTSIISLQWWKYAASLLFLISLLGGRLGYNQLDNLQAVIKNQEKEIQKMAQLNSQLKDSENHLAENKKQQLISDSILADSVFNLLREKQQLLVRIEGLKESKLNLKRNLEQIEQEKSKYITQLTIANNELATLKAESLSYVQKSGLVVSTRETIQSDEVIESATAEAKNKIVELGIENQKLLAENKILKENFVEIKSNLNLALVQYTELKEKFVEKESELSQMLNQYVELNNNRLTTTQNLTHQNMVWVKVNSIQQGLDKMGPILNKLSRNIHKSEGRKLSLKSSLNRGLSDVKRNKSLDEIIYLKNIYNLISSEMKSIEKLMVE